MRSPSGRCLDSAIDVYPGIHGQDADGGYRITYAATPTYAQVPATAQVIEYGEVFDREQNILVQGKTYRIMTGQAILVQARDKIVWVDKAGTSHTLQAEVDRDEAGRGGAFTIRATETL